MANVLKVDAVTKEFSDFVAVKSLSLELKSGEFVTLLGPSGCGKSTTLRMVGGFEEPTSGKIYIEGVDSTNIPPHKRNVNMVFQDYALFPHLTVRQNVAFGLQLKGLPEAEVTARVDELLKLVQLDTMHRRMPSELSGGQRQRVALARALAPNPPLLLLDEPLGALDAKLRREMQDELRRLQRATGKTFVLVTHDQEEALTMSDTIVVMNEGRIEQMGSPEELYNFPRTEFVARFIGEMNFLPVQVKTLADGLANVAWGQFDLRAVPASADVKIGSNLIGVRPDKITLHANQQGVGQDNMLNGRIEDRVFRGSSVHYTVEVNGVRFAVTASAEQNFPAGDQVVMAWSTQNTLLMNTAEAK
ncbi:ABC transporter ATP-binding protein [Devosia sp. MC532]|uniref:ABC transporter ATP-binding protein n=1 Tax=Devosia sp. MC532 TaxID=2799788 RepID=UPI0018F6CE61|nr:ABC transporter ATP-binding protein [Devosia sp. MC532]MBJ7578443.1 ABC transporter ATP-binding protein [Devosia sp. MC532]